MRLRVRPGAVHRIHSLGPLETRLKASDRFSSHRLHTLDCLSFAASLDVCANTKNFKGAKRWCGNFVLKPHKDVPICGRSRLFACRCRWMSSIAVRFKPGTHPRRFPSHCRTAKRAVKGSRRLPRSGRSPLTVRCGLAASGKRLLLEGLKNVPSGKFPSNSGRKRAKFPAR